MQTFANTSFRFGTVQPQDMFFSQDRGSSGPFRVSNTLGDWKTSKLISFDPPFGPATPGTPKGVGQEISVIVTPRQATTGVVPVVNDVSSKGFTFSARNDLPKEGDAAFDWLAVLGVPEQRKNYFDTRLSVLQPQLIKGQYASEQWPRVWFSEPMTAGSVGRVPAVPAVLISANNLNVTQYNCSTVGTVADLVSIPPPGLPYDGFSVVGWNVDDPNLDGAVGFYCAAFSMVSRSDFSQRTQLLWLDHGTERSCDVNFRNVFPGTPFPIASAQWLDFFVYFDKPFSAPPIVLATARGKTPIVPMVRNVTTHGFTLAVRDFESAGNAGNALFSWVAIGCGRGCG